MTRFRTQAMAIFLIAVAVRLVHLWQMRETVFLSALMGDARGYDAGARRLAAGDWIGSEVFYQAPLYPAALNNLGTALRAAGRVDEAVATYGQALAQGGDGVTLHVNLGNALMAQGRQQLEDGRRQPPIADAAT